MATTRDLGDRAALLQLLLLPVSAPKPGCKAAQPTAGSDTGALATPRRLVVASPLPTPIDPNATSTANLGSVDLDLGTDTCRDLPEPSHRRLLGNRQHHPMAAEYWTEAAFGTTDEVVIPSPWVAGGDCAYGSLGSNSASATPPRAPTSSCARRHKSKSTPAWSTAPPRPPQVTTAAGQTRRSTTRPTTCSSPASPCRRPRR